MTDWRDAGSCRREAVAHLFFSDDQADQALARSVCQNCPVLAECRDYVLNCPQREYGIWAGMSEDQRNRARRRPRSTAKCGTEGGYYHHRLLGQATCEACRSAHAQAERDRHHRGISAKQANYQRHRSEGLCAWCSKYMHHRCSGGDCACRSCAAQPVGVAS